MSVRSNCVAGLVAVAQVLAAQTVSSPPAAEDVFRAIRANDMNALRLLMVNRDAVHTHDRLSATPLHYAATYGSADAVRLLLQAGADVNARNNADATPLIYAAYDLKKTRLITDRGADVNAHAHNGVTPLMVACAVHGNVATVRYLLDKGADPKAVSATGADALENASLKGDPEMTRLLLARGADARHADKANETALLQAFESPGSETGRLLLAAGADVNAANTFAGTVKNGPIALVHQTPLLLAASAGDAAAIALLLKAGARVDEPDVRKMTPLMLAVATDNAELTAVRQLIAADADVNAKDIYGDSVLDWALKFRQPAIVAELEKAGAKTSRPPSPAAHPDFTAANPADAIERASALLAKSADTFFPAGGGCVGCHHQPLVASAYAAMRDAGLHPEERLQKIFRNGMVPEGTTEVTNLPFMLSAGGDYDRLLYQVLAMADLGDSPSPNTDAIVQYLAARQDPSGAWIALSGPRPPLESSSVLRTAMSIRALKTYRLPARQREFDERIARARKWLLAARPATNYERAYRVMGLHAAGAAESDVAAAGKDLLKEQKSNGGWSQNAWLEPDAYATSVALRYLCEAGLLRPSEATFARGTDYLLRTQFPDGSWYVASRAPKLQPYFESAFPYGHDQWISVSATAWAVMALAPAAAPQTRANTSQK
jgi:ankyrin repeat protein